jgi:HSP20 family molecular chaperone IbpA
METNVNVTNREERNPETTRGKPAMTPLVDIYENAEELFVLADVPGVAKENVSIDLNRDRLTLWAKRTSSNDGTPVGRDYYRVFLIPQGIDATKISAELTNGVLRIRLPKSDALRPRRIEVRGS